MISADTIDLSQIKTEQLEDELKRRDLYLDLDPVDPEILGDPIDLRLLEEGAIRLRRGERDEALYWIEQSAPRALAGLSACGARTGEVRAMKLTCERRALVAALGAAVRIVSRRTTIPILGNVLAEAEGDRLSLTVDNLDMRVTAALTAEVERPGATTMPVHMLSDLVKAMPSEARVGIDAPTAERAVMRCGRSRTTLATLPAADFPPGGREDFAHRFAIAGRDLGRALARCLIAASTEETRYYLNGVLIHAHETPDDAPMLRFVGTDGHRLVLTALPLMEAARGAPGSILPRQAALEVARLAGDLGEGAVEIALGQRLMRFEIGDLTLVTKLIDGRFPDYARVIPVGNRKAATVERGAIKGALDRVRQVLDAESRGRGAKFGFAPGGLTLSVRTDLNESVEEIDAETEDQIEIGFNIAYALQILDAVDGDRITFALEDPGSPTLITGAGDRSTTCVLMPMRV